MKFYLLTVLMLAGVCGAAPVPHFAVRTDFPGGNARVLAREGNVFTLAPDLRDTQAGSWWFYWNVKVSGPAGGKATLAFPGRDPIGTRGPAITRDGGRSWSWMGIDAVRTIKRGAESARAIDVVLPGSGPGAAEVQVAFCIPYVGANLAAFTAAHGNSAVFKQESLTRSRKGRDVPLLRLGRLEQPERIVLVTARHHACEAMASYVLEGFMTEVIARASTAEKNLWHRWQLVVSPFMDRDGVEDGDQGKLRNPHDHNRDYSDRPIYPEVAALQALAPRLAAPVFAALDMHCPYVRGGWHEKIHLVGAPDPELAAAQTKFLTLFESRSPADLPFVPADMLAFGVSWNNARVPNFAGWAARVFPKARLVSTLEFPYANVRDREVSAEDARAFGRRVAHAFERFSREGNAN